MGKLRFSAQYVLANLSVMEVGTLKDSSAKQHTTKTRTELVFRIHLDTHTPLGNSPFNKLYVKEIKQHPKTCAPIQ